MDVYTKIYRRLSLLGSALRLSFSSQETAGGKIMALDGMRRQLIILDNGNEEMPHTLINLCDVKKIYITRVYSHIEAGALSANALDEFVKAMGLRFIFNNRSATLPVNFYEAGKNNLSALPLLENKARNWQILLSKLSGSFMKNTAKG